MANKRGVLGMTLKIRNILSAVLVFGIIVLFSHTVFASDTVRVLVLPFTIHAEKDLVFLQQGIEKMLSSRLVSEGKVDVIRVSGTEIPSTLNRDIALGLVAEHPADYVILGSLTVFGESISTDVELIDVQKKEPVVTFNKLGNSKDDALEHVNMFAEQVNDTFKNEPSEDKVIVSKSEKPPIPQSDPVILSSSNDEKTHDFWKSAKIKSKVSSMTLGDVNGDGKNEIVLCSKKSIDIYRYTEDRLETISAIGCETYNSILSVDTADINSNGRSEIFVTNLRNKNGRLISFVLEWDGKTFQKIVTDADWYFRVLERDGKKVLLGQKKTTGSFPFQKEIFEMKWVENQYTPSETLDLPKDMILYGFIFGDALNKGKEVIVSFTRSDYLQILYKNGDEEWTSDERYGGNTTYLEIPSEYDTRETSKFYLPQRIHLADLDMDGKNEVIAVKNKDMTGRLFARLRGFSSGHIESLSWNNIGMWENWRTQKMGGYISDYAIGDLDNDGNAELVFSRTRASLQQTCVLWSHLVRRGCFPLDCSDGVDYPYPECDLRLSLRQQTSLNRQSVKIRPVSRRWP